MITMGKTWNTDMFEDVLRKINIKPKQLDDIDEWLFVVVNTMKAIIDNSCKEEVFVQK